MHGFRYEFKLDLKKWVLYQFYSKSETVDTWMIGYDFVIGPYIFGHAI